MEFVIGLVGGFAASIGAALLIAWVQRPNPIAGDVLHSDNTYDVGINENGVEERYFGQPGVRDIKRRDLTFLLIGVRNSPHENKLLRLFSRDVAWATQASVKFRQFFPGEDKDSRSASRRSFHFYGRWASTPEPMIPTEAYFDKGRSVDILHGRQETLGIAVKYDRDDSAYGFTNESYTFARRGKGLWRHPDYEIPLGTHFCVAINLHTTIVSKPFHYHAHNEGTRPRDLEIHRWGSCQHCRAPVP